MASLKELNLNDENECETWLRVFEAAARHKKLNDGDRTRRITDFFISSAGISAVHKVAIMCKPLVLENMKFEEIKAIIMKNIKPHKKVVLAERAYFMRIVQEKDESILSYLHRLREKAQFCEFDMLNSDKSIQSAENDLIQMRLIDGLANKSHRSKIMEMVQTGTSTMSLSKCVDVIQQLEMIDKSGESPKYQLEEQSMTANVSEINYGKQAQKHITNCKYCGGSHAIRKCPAFGKTCNKCGKRNHFAGICRSRSGNVQSVEEKDETLDITDVNVNNVWSIQTALEVSSIDVKTEKVLVNDKWVPMQVDTGADISVISTKVWKDIFGSPKLEKYSQKLEVYDGHELKTRGKMVAVIDKNGKYQIGDIVIVESRKPFGLLGRNFLEEFARKQVNQCDSLKSGVSVLPVIKGVKASMELKDGVTPKFCRARPVPLALEEKVKNELDRLESLGVISPITGGVENCSPVVWVRKPNDELRCCADFKVHVNDKIKTDSYPLPKIETIFAKLKNAKVFAKIDLRSAYWQIELDEKAKDLSIINTTKGLYRMNRLTMGMKNAASIFQKVMEGVLSDIKGILIYQDDIAIFAENMESLEKRLKAVKTRLREKNITINEEKSVEYCESLTFLGFKISAKGIEPDNRLVNKIQDIKVPTTCKEVAQFLGLINYFGRFIPNFSSKIAPLNEIRRMNTFQWTAKCMQSFESLKKEISSHPVVQPYSLQKEATLTTDSSKSTLGAVLTQEGHPVIFVSRCLSKAEQNYANIEREALAVVWATMRLKQFLMGRHFKIQTDHQPLVKLFGRHPIPTGTSARICKWALDLMSYDYDIEYIPGKQIPHADALSRLQYENDPSTSSEDISVEKCINAVNFEQKILEISEVENELKFDKIAIRVMQRIKEGNWSDCSEAERPFRRVSDALTIHQNVLYLGTRLYIPPRLRQKVFDITHSERHAGIQSNIHRICLAAWWPGLSWDVMRMTKQCETCNKIRPVLTKSCDTWPKAEPFERMHMDWAFVKDAGNVLVIVDSATGWIEAFLTKERSTNTVIKCLRTVFTRFGIPKLLVSDNALEFTSDELVLWLNNQGTEKRESPPYFPRANGTAERSVQIVKRALMAWTEIKTHQDFSAFLQRVLFHHRISSHSRGASPAELVFNRKIRIPIVTQFHQGQTITYKPTLKSETSQATYLMTKGSNTSWILKDDNLTLASNNQIAPFETQGDDLIPIRQRSSRLKQKTIRLGIDD